MTMIDNKEFYIVRYSWCTVSAFQCEFFTKGSYIYYVQSYGF